MITKFTNSIFLRVEAENFQPHGLKVFLRYRAKPSGLLDFERLWRQHFVDSMQPRRLPDGWRVDFRHDETLTVQNALTDLCQATADVFMDLMYA